MKSSKFNPVIHDRKSIRLKGFDYSNQQYYFITICSHFREPLFGQVAHQTLVLNEAGMMINKVWTHLPNKFPSVRLHNHIVMPDHIHGVIEIIDSAAQKRVPLHTILQWFKTMTTNAYIRHVHSDNWPTFIGKLWQRNYYEHIIRDEKSLFAIIEYINANPKNWLKDQHAHES